MVTCCCLFPPTVVATTEVTVLTRAPEVEDWPLAAATCRPRCWSWAVESWVPGCTCTTPGPVTFSCCLASIALISGSVILRKFGRTI